MTACNIFVQGQSAHLVCDTGWYWPDGRVAGFGSKVIAMPALRMAFAVRGSPVLLLNGGLQHTGADSPEAMLMQLPDLLAELSEQGRRRYPRMIGPDDWTATVSAIYWNEAQRRACGAVMCNEASNDMPPGYVPWMWEPVQECLSPGVELAEVFGTEPDTSDPRAFPIEEGALRVIEAQRSSPWGVNGGPQTCRVGGAAELTTVSAKGVETRTLRVWGGDRVGAIIDV